MKLTGSTGFISDASFAASAAFFAASLIWLIAVSGFFESSFPSVAFSFRAQAARRTTGRAAITRGRKIRIVTVTDLLLI